MTLAVGLIVSETRQVETAAQNIANLATPGYKREIAFSDLLSREGASPAAPVVPTNRAVASDFMPGKLVHTGNPLDLALGGGGFLEVSTPEGPAFIRGGTFQLDAGGRFVTQQGWVLQSAGGGDVSVRSSDWKIASDGTVIDDGNAVAVIGTASFGNPGKLTRLGSGLYRADGVQPVELADPRVLQGFLEASNVSNGNEMVRMMEAVRRIESGQKLVHTYDDMMATVLQRLGDM
ncbi:flagellar hook-basal body protein [Burkholderia sp. BCC1977]|uniref:flagellar hook-basal body protein n=1 Tax=Burkholderia sp. BCC1977 TaxID=2817440 RepID=UPI002ABE1E3B|nr:flagellar hook-basal body protein [Burkholderia sp. BCC1977]